ncbi:hypothetical protein SCA6_007944 [Theobroma cacao]
MVVLLWLSLQSIIDLVVAGISLMIGLGIFAFIASVLCSAAFLHHAKNDADNGEAIDVATFCWRIVTNTITIGITGLPDHHGRLGC